MAVGFAVVILTSAGEPSNRHLRGFPFFVIFIVLLVRVRFISRTTGLHLVQLKDAECRLAPLRLHADCVLVGKLLLHCSSLAGC